MVIKIADFGVARHGSPEGQMTAETGTYRWMAPEVCLSSLFLTFEIWTSYLLIENKGKFLHHPGESEIVPYDNMTPLQAALGVRQGLRLDIPGSVHPRLSKLIQQCWHENPDVRPTFAEIIVELEDILHHGQVA
nr:unnamed protein product [Digitaria exilis]